MKINGKYYFSKILFPDMIYPIKLGHLILNKMKKKSSYDLNHLGQPGVYLKNN